MAKLAMLAGAALLAAPTVFAAQNNSHFDLYYTTGEVATLDADGYGLKANVHFNPRFFMGAEINRRAIEFPFFGDLDLEEYRIGAGLRQNMQGSLDFLGKAEWIGLGGDFDSVSGFGVHAGLGFHPTPKTTLGASVGYIDIEDGNGTEINLGGALQFNRTWGGILEYRDQGGDFDANEIRLAARLSFGN